VRTMLGLKSAPHMGKPVAVQPGLSQRATETPLVSPLPIPSAPPLPAEIVRSSLRASIKDAAAWSVMQGVGTNYLTPFVSLGGRGLIYLAAFAALPALASGIVQWFSANLTDVFGRRNRIIIGAALLQAFIWLPICISILLPQPGGYLLMLACYVIFVGLANFANPAWQSVMGDLVPADRRGRYFGIRNAISGVVLVGSFFAAGGWLGWCEGAPVMTRLGLSGRDFGFLVLFALAGLARLLSAYYLSQVHEPEYRRTPADRFTFLEFIRRAPRAHFGRFVFYCTLINAAFGLTGPFFAWYLLDQLRFGPTRFAVVVTASLLCNVATQPLWGRLVDRIGSKRVIAMGGVAIAFWPLLILACRDFWHFVAVMCYDGISTAAYSIAVGNYFYDVVTPPKRARCVAYYTLFIGVGSAVGSFGGAALGLLTPLPLHLPGLTLDHPYSVLLAASTIVRLLTNALLLGTFEEFRLRRPVFAPASPPGG